MLLLALRDRLARARRPAAPEAREQAAPLRAASPFPAAPASPAAPAPPAVWTLPRLRVVEALWGEGFLLPGGAEEVLRLAVPLGLSAASSVLLLGVGSGGPSVRLAGDLGVWVHGHEADPFLAEMAARRIQRAGVALAKRATVASWDPAAPAFDRHAFHHALAVQALRVRRPEDVLTAMAQAVQPGGQIALLETVAPAPLDAADPMVAAWLRMEPGGAPLPDPARIGMTLERLGFQVRVAEDISQRHMRLAVRGWRVLLRSLAADRPDAAHAALLVAEADLWLRRIRLMRAGRIRMMCWLAVERRGAT
jgi:cyclopropane fatty-acyl-phospholipid synthase-like methyltransferase